MGQWNELLKLWYYQSWKLKQQWHKKPVKISVRFIICKWDDKINDQYFIHKRTIHGKFCLYQMNVKTLCFTEKLKNVEWTK